MKTIKIDLPQDMTEAEIIPMADLHLGDTHCEYKKIQDTIAYVLEAENRFVILNGDLCDNAIKSSIGDVYGENLKPMEQLEHCVQLFGELAKKNRILCVLPGNHEARTYRQDGIDITDLMCNQLGISDRYTNTTALIFIRLGMGRASGKSQPKRPIYYSMYCTHGSGGGRREGGKINRLADLASIVDSDIYIHSHTHLPIIMKQSYYRVSYANSTVTLVPKLFVNTNSYLGYGGYGDAQAFKPPSTDQPIIHLSGTKKLMKATL